MGLTRVRPSQIDNSVATILTGEIIQSVAAVVPAKVGTTTITLSNAVPLITSGTQIWTTVIKPVKPASRIRVTGTFTYVAGTSSRILMAFVFRGSTCIGTFGSGSSSTNQPNPITIDVLDSPLTSAATTYSVRVASTAAQTWYVNQFAAPYFGGTLALSSIALQELA